MRIALIGLSTPIFYDYSVTAERAPSDTQSSPNPVLDSAFGLLLMYDEIWFVCRSLCPQNMRNLPYVKFLDEAALLPKTDDIQVPSIELSLDRTPELNERYERFRSSIPDYREMLKRVGINWEAAADNHSHGLQIGAQRMMGNSSLSNMFFDMEIINRLDRPGLELVCNSFLQGWFEQPENPLLTPALAELLVIENIPNYLTSIGPYHPCVEEARENEYLKSFRTWVHETGSKATRNELLDIKNEVKAAIDKVKNEVFLKWLGKNTQYESAAKLVGGIVVDCVVPGSSAVAQAADALRHFFDSRSVRWQGFIVSSAKWND